MSGGGAWEIEEVASHSDADMVDFGLDGLNGGNHTGVDDFTVVRNRQFGYKDDSVGASGHGGADALCKVA